MRSLAQAMRATLRPYGLRARSHQDPTKGAERRWEERDNHVRLPYLPWNSCSELGFEPREDRKFIVLMSTCLSTPHGMAKIAFTLARWRYSRPSWPGHRSDTPRLTVVMRLDVRSRRMLLPSFRLCTLVLPRFRVPPWVHLSRIRCSPLVPIEYSRRGLMDVLFVRQG